MDPPLSFLVFQDQPKQKLKPLSLASCYYISQHNLGSQSRQCISLEFIFGEFLLNVHNAIKGSEKSADKKLLYLI